MHALEMHLTWVDLNPKHVKCAECSGTGIIYKANDFVFSAGDPETCFYCGGRGFKTITVYRKVEDHIWWAMKKELDRMIHDPKVKEQYEEERYMGYYEI